MSIEVGAKGRAETIVTEQNTAAAVGSGLVPVFATPYMEEGQGSVGTHLDVSHDSATPIGMKVWAEAEVTAVDGKALTFSVTAYDEAGVIGKGTHNRFIITVDRFLAKTEKKKEGR